MYLLSGLVQGTADDDLLKSLVESGVVSEELVKSVGRQGLVQREVSVKGKDGRVYSRKQWVRPGDEPTVNNRTPKQEENNNVRGQEEQDGQRSPKVRQDRSGEQGEGSDNRPGRHNPGDSGSRGGGNNPGDKAVGDASVGKQESIKPVKANPKEFQSAIQKAKDSAEYGCCVDVHTEEEYAEMNCLSYAGGKAGVAIKPDGDITSVFNHSDSGIRGFVKTALRDAVKNGGQKLDCYSINAGLPRLYSKCGFTPVCRIKWDNRFKPDDWNDDLGEPDLVFFAYVGDNPDDIVDKYNETKGMTRDDVAALPLIEGKNVGKDNEEYAYDLACSFRDKWLEEQKEKAPNKAQEAMDGFFSFKGSDTQSNRTRLASLLQGGESQESIMESARSQGVTWEESDNPAINWLRASIAMTSSTRKGEE